MQIEIDGRVYMVPEQYQKRLLMQLLDMGKAEYSKLNQSWRVLAKPFARGILQVIEKEVTKKHGREAGIKVRPPDRNADPVLHLADLMGAMLGEAVKHVHVAIQTEERTDTVSDISATIQNQGQSGGQVDTDRYVGVG